MAVAGLAISASATGTLGPNPPQSGVINYTGTNQSATVTFPYPFQTTPLLFLQAAATNSTPLTNSVLTTTNFTVTVAATNASLTWSAYVGGTRLQSGTNSITGGTPVTNTFAFPYSQLPVIVASGSSTNTASAAVAVTSFSTTGFVIQSTTSQAVSWIAVGTVANPASANTGTYPGQNAVIY